MDYEDWSEPLNSFGPLRMSQVSDFLHESGRPDTCPFCSYAGAWDFHIRWPDDGLELEADPLMSVYELSGPHLKQPNECVAITCPKCAHFSHLDVNRIKMYFIQQQRLKGLPHG